MSNTVYLREMIHESRTYNSQESRVAIMRVSALLKTTVRDQIEKPRAA